MKKIILIIIAFWLIGCSTVTYQTPSVYDKYKIEDVALLPDNQTGIIKLTRGLYVWKVGQNQIVSNFDQNFRWGKRPRAVRLAEGQHTLFIKGSDGVKVIISRINIKANHEYLVEHIKKRDKYKGKIYYWVRDLTNNKIVYGKKVTQEELEQRSKKQ